MISVGHSLNTFYKRYYNSMQEQLLLRGDVQSTMNSLFQACGTNDDALRTTLIEETKSELTASQDRLDFIKQNKWEKNQVAAIEEKLAGFVTECNTIIGMLEGGDTEGALVRVDSQSADAADALLALLDMDLVQITDSPFTLRVPPAKKTDPSESAVWRLIQAMKINV